jgi:ComF family protein
VERAVTLWRRVADAVLSATLAPPCAVCQQILEQPLAGAVCERCWRLIDGGPLRIQTTGLISSAGAIGEYEGVLRDIIHVLKYQGRRSTAARLSALMAAHGAHVLADADAVVPVPLHARRERERGFNQADDLTCALQLPVTRALRRLRSTAPQVDLPAAERQGNVKNAFEVVDRVRGLAVAGKTLVLVDDVTTTGATLEACARVLRNAGAADVRALTAARVSSARR